MDQPHTEHTILRAHRSDSPQPSRPRQANPRLALRRLPHGRNLTPDNLWTVGRAVSLYSLVMPVAAPAPERSFLAPPTYVLALVYAGRGTYPSTTLFLEPARNLAGNALSLLAAGGVMLALGAALVTAAGRARAGDPFHLLLGAQAFTGWIFYTWFNPIEPFLWIAEFLPLTVPGPSGAGTPGPRGTPDPMTRGGAAGSSSGS